MAGSIDDQVAEYRGLVDALARKLAATSRAKQVGAEYDDLAQEGLIDVWQSIARGVTPSARVIESRMADWVKHLGAQKGMGRGRNARFGEYESALPLEDFRAVPAQG